MASQAKTQNKMVNFLEVQANFFFALAIFGAGMVLWGLGTGEINVTAFGASAMIAFGLVSRLIFRTAFYEDDKNFAHIN